MNRKRWVRLIFILLPISLILVQIFWQPPLERPQKIRMAIRTLIPPIGMILRYFDFNEKNALAKWEEKLFQGRVAYWVDFEKADGFIHAKSKQSASAIFYRLKFDVSKYPYISWKWRVGKFPDKSHVTDRKKWDDFAVRFYVVFVSRFFTNFRCVEYVWDESLPQGTILESPYADQIKQIVVRSGPSEPDEWVLETRNVFEDYGKLFGKPPKMKAAAIALMTSSAGSQSEAEGFFDDIRIGKSATQQSSAVSQANRGGFAAQLSREEHP